MVPSASWGISLAHLLAKPIWDEVRRECYRNALYICEICTATNTQLHCHEQWEYDDRKHTQFLKALVCLCKDCHDIKHWGRTVACINDGTIPRERFAELTLHFCRVNNCTPKDFLDHKVDVGNLWDKRSKTKYKIDFGKLSPEAITEEYNRRHKYGKI